MIRADAYMPAMCLFSFNSFAYSVFKIFPLLSLSWVMKNETSSYWPLNRKQKKLVTGIGVAQRLLWPFNRGSIRGSDNISPQGL